MNRLTLTGILIFFLVNAAALELASARSNYVVIGAFRNKDNAVHFTDAARAHHYDASYAINKVRQLYYVFVLHTEDVNKAIQQATELRLNTEYTGAWVYHGVLGDEQVQDGIEIISSWSAPEIQAAVGIVANGTVADSSTVAKTATPPLVTGDLPPAGDATDAKATTKLFFFKLYTPDNRVKNGNVEEIDLDRQKKAGVLKANEPVVVKAVNTSGDLRFDCQVAGYRRLTQTVNFKNPGAASETGVSIQDNVIIVPFELVRLKKGDRQILFNIYFYKDAAIMRPESKYELDELLAMMNENTKYRIKFHGHTNGKASGKIIEMGESRNFFSLSGSDEGFGSAKKLSAERAQLLVEYLTSEGIEQGRMETKAWGGKKPIYDKDHAQASSNVRVEVEILQD
jgi:outer membrane protein OmpA-like peptidoglycan-associated protein